MIYNSKESLLDLAVNLFIAALLTWGLTGLIPALTFFGAFSSVFLLTAATGLLIYYWSHKE
jgi:hypothetical protein